MVGLKSYRIHQYQDMYNRNVQDSMCKNINPVLCLSQRQKKNSYNQS